MAWMVQGWTRWALAGLAVVVLGVGVAGVLLFGKTRRKAPDAYRDASPVSHVDSKSAPTLILHGTADDIVPLDQSRKLRDALAGAGVEVKLVELEGEGHNFQKPPGARQMVRTIGGKRSLLPVSAAPDSPLSRTTCRAPGKTGERRPDVPGISGLPSPTPQALNVEDRA